MENAATAEANLATEDKSLLKTGIIVLVLLLFLGIGIYYYGKKSAPSQINQLTPPSDTVNGVSGASDATLTTLSAALSVDLNSWISRNNDLYNQMLNLSDTDLVRLYNIYNNNYETSTGETLTQAMSNHFIDLGTSFDLLRDNVLANLTRLGAT
jgi:hypothetical protein